MSTYLQRSLSKIANAIEINQNETLLIQWWGSQSDQSHLTHLAAELSKKNLNVKTLLFDETQVVDAFNSTAHLSSDNLPNNHLRREDFSAQSTADNIIDILRFAPPMLMVRVTDEAKPHFMAFMRGLFSAISSPKNQMIQLRLPSEEAAAESGLSPEIYENLWHDLIDVDYAALKNDCQSKIQYYSTYKAFEVRSGDNCCLTFQVADRSWYSDHGNGDFPAGEIYIAPIESSANGSFYVPIIHWEDTVLKDVTLEFADGLLTACSHPKIMATLSEVPGDALRFAEFGIGLNPNHTNLCGYSLFDEKSLGTCHIAIGMNELFGGSNACPLHVDFVTPSLQIIGK